MSKKLLFSEDSHRTYVLAYQTVVIKMKKDVQQLCSRSVLFYLNGVYTILCYPNAVLERSCTLYLMGDMCACAC